MKTRLISAACAVAVALAVIPATSAQEAAEPAIPKLPFQLVENFFHYPAYSILGRVSGMAVAPNGTIAVLVRGNHPVLEFKSDGTFVRSWGEGSDMFLGAHTLRFDKGGDLWYIDAGDNVIFRFDSEGRTIGRLGNNPEPWTWTTHVIERAVPNKTAFYQETDIGWSKDGTSFIADGYGNSRVVKYSKEGNYIKAWGERGDQPGNFNTPHGLVVDDNDVIYVADRGNNRIQTFDTEGNLKAVWKMPTAPWSVCLTNGPDQKLFVGSVAKVYKMDLTGKILGVFGRSGRMPGTIDSIHQLACPDENTLYLANLYGSRIDKWVIK